MKAVLFSGGQIADYDAIRRHLQGCDLVLCADSGVRHALALGLTPTLMLGDFDSTDPGLVAEMAARGVPVQRVPWEKDETDTNLAVNEAIRRGATEILLVGATGDRLDHTLSNLLLLPGVPVGVTVTLVDPKNTIRLLRPGGRLCVSGEPGEFISLLPLTPEVKGVVIEGVKWPLSNATLRWGESLGISNQMVEPEAFVAVRDGYLLVIQARD